MHLSETLAVAILMAWGALMTALCSHVVLVVDVGRVIAARVLQAMVAAAVVWFVVTQVAGPVLLRGTHM